MPITFHIPGALREFTAGKSTIIIDGTPPNVGDALAMLCALHPGLRDRIFTEQGQIRQHINVFVGNEHIRYAGGLVAPLSGNPVISIVPAVSGGKCGADLP